MSGLRAAGGVAKKQAKKAVGGFSGARGRCRHAAVTSARWEWRHALLQCWWARLGVAGALGGQAPRPRCRRWPPPRVPPPPARAHTRCRHRVPQVQGPAHSEKPAGGAVHRGQGRDQAYGRGAGDWPRHGQPDDEVRAGRGRGGGGGGRAVPAALAAAPPQARARPTVRPSALLLLLLLTAGCTPPAPPHRQAARARQASGGS